MKSPSAITRRLRKDRQRRGYAMAMVLGLLVILSLMGSGVLAMSTSEGMLYTQSYLKRQAFYLAEAGNQRLIANLVECNDWNLFAGTVFTGESLGPGTYNLTLTLTGPNTAIIETTGVCSVFHGDERRDRVCKLKVNIAR